MCYPCLWFKTEAEEAAKFYTSIFKNSRITNTTYYTDAGPGPKGSVLTVMFELDGAKFMALNGLEKCEYTHALSLVMPCEDQAELDRIWDKLADGGQIIECGWVKDKYGVSWQVVPKQVEQWVSGDPERVDRFMRAMMTMKKLDIAALKQAYEAEPASRS